MTFSRSYISCLILLVVIGCDESIPIQNVNPFDPQSPYFVGNNVDGMSMESLGRKKVKIRWNDKSSYEEGFNIEKNSIGDNESEQIKAVKNQNNIVDTNLSIIQIYKYKIATRTKTEYFKYSDSIIIRFDPYQKKYQNSEYQPVIDISGNSKRIVTYSKSGGYDIYNLSDSLVFYKTVVGQGTPHLSYDGNYIAYSRADQVGCYDILNDIKIVLRNSSFIGSVYSCMSKDNKYVVELRDDMIIVLWDITNNISKEFNTGLIDRLLNIGISPDGNYLVGRSASKTYLWKFNTFELYNIFEGKINYLFNYNSTMLIYSYLDKIYFWDITAKNVISQIDYMDSNVISMELIQNEELLAAQIGNGIYLFELRNYNPILHYTAITFSETLLSGKFAKNGDYFIPNFTLSEYPSGCLLKYKDEWKIIKSY